MCICISLDSAIPRGGKHAQLTIEDVYFIHALKAKVPTNWISLISDHVVKINKQYIYHLPYVVFISKVLRHYYIDLTGEVTLDCSKKNIVEKLALHHMGLRKDENGWSFKDEHMPLVEEIEPLRVHKSEYSFKPR